MTVVVINGNASDIDSGGSVMAMVFETVITTAAGGGYW